MATCPTCAAPAGDLPPARLRGRAFGVVAALFALCLSGGSARADEAAGFSLTVTPPDQAVRVGGTVAFEARVTHSGAQSPTRATTGGGVGLGLQLPLGFAIDEGSLRIGLPDGQEVPGAVHQGDGGMQLRQLDGGAAQPLDPSGLAGGQALRFRFKLRATTRVRPMTVGVVGVSLGDAPGMPLGPAVQARVRVEAEPEFDLGFVVGTVYCDDNENGRRDEGEAGLGGVRLVSDTGRAVDTDRLGRWHIRDLRPGAHLVKLDENTLPPQSTLRGSPRALIDITPGLPAKASFAVSCRWVTARPDSVSAPPRVVPVKPPAPRALSPKPPSAFGDLGLGGEPAGGPPPFSGATFDAAPEPVTPDGQTTFEAETFPDETPPEGFDTAPFPGEAEPDPEAEAPVILTPAPAPEPAWVTLRGNVETFELSAGPVRVAPARLGLQVATGGGEAPLRRALNIPWRPAGLSQPIDLHISVDHSAEGPAASIETWELTIERVDGARRTPVRLHLGRGAPPSSFRWDGLDATGELAIQKGVLFEARARVSRRGEGWRDILVSAPVRIGFDWKPGVLAETLGPLGGAELGGRLFDDEDRPLPALPAAVRGLKPLLDAFPGALVVIEVHREPSESAERDVLRTGRQAYSVGEALRREFRHPADRVATIGHGARRSPGPATTRAEREAQRRVVVTLWAHDDPTGLIPPESDRHAPLISVNGRVFEPAPTGEFGTMTPAEADLVLAMAASDDARRELALLPAHDPDFEETEASRLFDDPLVDFGGDPLRRALGEAAVTLDPVTIGTRTADQLTVQLPARGSELQAPRLFVQGQTHPDNIVTVAGQRLPVSRDGRFAELVAVPTDLQSLSIESRDKAGYVARLDWPLKVSQTEFFLMMLADGSAGQAGARLTELGHYDTWRGEDLFAAGRGALYAKGRISGAVLGKDLSITTHLDTTRRDGFEPFFQQIVDPARDYVVFGDGTDDRFAANARGPLYVMIEVDRSRIGWGSVHTDLRGLQLFRYERTFDGAHADIDLTLAEGWRTQAKGFVSADNQNLVRRYDELRATGGTLYYLSGRMIARGSERVDLVLRELDTGMEIGRARLERDRHYRIDYTSGRVMTEAPIPSVVDAFFSIDGYQPFGGRNILDGHQVWVVVGYEVDAANLGGDIAFGGQVTQEIGGVLELGGGMVREGAKGGTDPAYSQWGVHAKVKATENSFAAIEYARSRASDGVVQRSTDGGLRYDTIDRARDADSGWGLFATMQAEVGELAGLTRETLDLQVRGHWQLLQPGFRTAGLAHEEATEKWGGEVVWRPTESIRTQFRYDGGTFLLDPPADAGVTGQRAIVRNRFHARYDQALDHRWQLFGELTAGQHRDDRRPMDVPATGGLAVGVRLKVLPQLTLSLSQDVLYGGDDRVLGEGSLARMQTNVGIEYGLTDDTAFRLIESVRWNGDNATRLGLVSRLGEGARGYLEERIERGDRNGRIVRATVLGAETEFGGPDGRAYGEYRLDGGVGGPSNRAVVGLGRAFDIVEGVRATVAYERSQAMEAPGNSGRGSRDVLSGGLQLLGFDRLKLSGIFEVRWDRDRPAEAAAEAFQGVARLNANFKLTDAFTVVGFLDYALSEDLATRALLAEHLVATLGLAWRPWEHDDFMAFFRWSRVIDRDGHRTTDLFGQDTAWTSRSDSDLLSLGAIIELPFRLQLTEKLVWRRGGLRAGQGEPIAQNDALLWITRLAFHVFDKLDLAGEFRALFSLVRGKTEQNGGLIEASYVLADHARIGVGWNMNGFAGGVLPEEQLNDIQSGFFMRVTGMY